MSHNDYSTEDFLADESFQAFVLGHDEEAAQFWRNWIALHAGREAAFYEAVAVLEQFAVQNRPVSATLRQAELDKLWNMLRQPNTALPQPMFRASRPKRLRQWAVAAGSVAVLGLATFGIRNWANPAAEWTNYATNGSEFREVTLPDGSRVVLNTNSTLKLANSWQPGQAREVWLSGEAYFKVQHTAPAAMEAVATAPTGAKFIVHAGSLDVAVLGTQFDVLSRPDKTQVVLNSGQIQLTRHQGNALEHVLLKPGELVEYNEVAPPKELEKREVTAHFYSAWTSGQLDFNNTPVSEIVALLENTYGLKIKVTKPHLLQQKLTGSVPNRDLDMLLDALSKSLDVTVRRKGNRVWLD